MFLLSSVPVVFGAVHPFIHGIYSFVVILLSGSWLILYQGCTDLSSIDLRILIIPFVLLVYVLLCSVPVPLSLISVLSPYRAHAVRQVNILTGSDITLASLSYQGISGLSMVGLYLSLLLFFLLCVSLMNRERDFFRKICVVLVVIGSLEAVYGLLQVVFPRLGVLWLPNNGHVACGSIIYRNQYAALLNLCWPIGMALYLDNVNNSGVRKKSGVRKLGKGLLSGRFVRDSGPDNNKAPFFCFLVMLMMLAVLFSLSRAGISTMLVIWGVLFLLLPFSRRKIMYLFILILSVLLFYGNLIGFNRLIDRFFTIETSGVERFHVWLSSLPMIYDHWLTGIGLDSYRLLSPSYLKFFPEDLFWTRVHNEYIETMLELGVPAAILLFSWIFFRLGSSYHYLFHARNRKFSGIRLESLLAVCTLASLTGFLFHGIVDFAWKLPANAFLATSVAALLHYCGRQTWKWVLPISAPLNEHRDDKVLI